ncbi:zinc finger protein 62 homolog [Malaya genurostris]|uniref:zinc finger protein 62 homolog n=1 Tax=Malaya genurostris TaxID=325434 RepID=UPI0026F40132|nr:zinc finger protein 62 homolog [Malaya genurostris]
MDILTKLPTLCRICFKPAREYSIAISVEGAPEGLYSTYGDLLNEISFIPPQELAEELPSNLCGECILRLNDFVKLKQQSTIILRFSVAMLNGTRSNDFQPLIDLLRTNSELLKQRLCSLNNIKEEEFSVQQIINNLLIKTEQSNEKQSFSETMEVEEIEVNELDEEYTSPTEFFEDGMSETEAENVKKRKRKRDQTAPKSEREVIRRDGCRYKMCGLNGCNVEYQLGDRGLYLLHERTFHRWACNLCGRVLASRTSFRNHVLLHDGEKSKCEFCERTFTTKGSMMTHVREYHNTSGVNFTCFYCGMGFMEQKDHFAHMVEHRECKHCNKKFSDTASWIAHTRRKHPDILFTCDQCDRTSLSQFFLDRHKRMKHSAESIIEQQPKRFTIIAINGACFHNCPQCNAQFITEPLLLQHNEEAHKRTEAEKQDNTIKRRPKEEREKFDYRYSCDICGKRYRFKNSLWSHKNKEHRGTEQKAICDICGNRYKHQSYLTAHHAKIHATEFPFRCHLCSKAYSQASYLKEHMKSHDPEKSFKCHHCDYRARQAHVLQTHITRKHTSERPIRCPECDKGFICSADLRRHISVHSQELPFRCEECAEAFRRKCDLGWHRSKVHLGLGSKQRKQRDDLKGQTDGDLDISEQKLDTA